MQQRVRLLVIQLRVTDRQIAPARSLWIIGISAVADGRP